MKMCLIYLKKDGKNFIYDHEIYRSLLNSLEVQRIQIDFQCRSGYCGVCRLRILKGTVKYKKTPLACICKNEILPCCCLPINDIILDL